jgi:peptidoglycan/xylan/chitin deacetylase (PgdA/CDA1 family)
VRRPLATAVKAASAGYDLIRPPAEGLVVLVYHRVGGRTAVTVDLPRSLFAEQVAALAERHQPLTIDRAVDHLGAGRAPAGRPAVVVSFDDGTADFVDEALPVLVEHGVPAVLYVATDFVEHGRSFPDGGVPVSWAGLADSLSTGLVTVGSHTHGHRLLDRVNGPAAASELDRSIDLIGARLGVPTDHFAYPKALLGSPAAEQEVRRRFRSAAIGRTRPNPWAATDVHRITRTPVQTTDGMRWFTRKAAGGMRLENDLRDRLNRRRYAAAVS